MAIPSIIFVYDGLVSVQCRFILQSSINGKLNYHVMFFVVAPSPNSRLIPCWMSANPNNNLFLDFILIIIFESSTSFALPKLLHFDNIFSSHSSLYYVPGNPTLCVPASLRFLCKLLTAVRDAVRQRNSSLVATLYRDGRNYRLVYAAISNAYGKNCLGVLYYVYLIGIDYYQQIPKFPLTSRLGRLFSDQRCISGERSSCLFILL